jgi:hypothetical protein
MALLKGERANFATIQRACRNGDLALVECTDRKTGKRVAVVAAIGRDNGEFVISPLCRLFDGNPYDELDPPS